ncbi:MAG: hypothetical protein IJD99_12070 [Clostridia bacterium]|nr:hypothetical protein [Clostridia bacterium]
MKNWKRFVSALIFATLLCGIAPGAIAQETSPCWNVGFARRQIALPENSAEPLYIAGYNSAWEIEGVLDLCEARAVWLDAGQGGVLLIGIDCIALDSGTVNAIRTAIGDIPGCIAINVYATHTHAGPDTLGLWGPTGVNGKNSAYMENLIAAAAEAGREAAANPRQGRLFFGYAVTEDMYRDSRYPYVYDPNLYQLRFEASDGSAGTRIYIYGAHAESLRGDNKLVSRDFPGRLCDTMTALTGDNTMFCSGPAGGLIMTKAFVSDTGRQAVENLEITANKLIEYAKSITPEAERELKPALQFSRSVFTVPLDNPAFALYKLLGILSNKAVKADSATGHGVETELAVLLLDDLAVTLIPGEIFPELVLGGETGWMNYGAVNPRPLNQIAQEHGIDQMIVIGLCNDELGYIVPPSDFLINQDAPYIERITDGLGEDHYEETNSVGPACAPCIADALEAALKNLK